MIDWLVSNSGIVGLCFFVATFAVIFVWTYGPSRKATLEDHRFIPFKGDE